MPLLPHLHPSQSGTEKPWLTVAPRIPSTLISKARRFSQVGFHILVVFLGHSATFVSWISCEKTGTQLDKQSVTGAYPVFSGVFI